MFNLDKYVLPTSFAGDGAGSGGGDGSGAGDNGSGGDKDTVSKADHDKVMGELSQLKDDYSDLRLEVMSPNYLAYLDNKGGDGDAGVGGKKKGEEKAPIGDDVYEKMSKKEIFEAAKKASLDEIRGELTAKDTEAAKLEKERKTARVTEFAKTHEDFETYRPVMYGLSTDKQNHGKSLEQLYDMAKIHVSGIHTKANAAEVDRQKKLASEKPGGSNDSYERLKTLSTDDAAKEALEETKSKMNIDRIPLA